MLLRAIKHICASDFHGEVALSIVLEAHDRHVRRKLIVAGTGEEVLIDLQRPVFLENGDHLELSDGRFLKAIAAEEDLVEVVGESPAHLVRLAWHIGNRHLSAQLDIDRILIKSDPVIETMLSGLGGRLRQVRETFHPEYGAYHGH